MRAGLLIRGAAASGAVTVAPMPAGRGLAPLADIPDRQRRDGFSQLVVRREYSWLVSRWQAMPVLSRRRDEIGEPVQKLKRRELDDTIGSRPGGRSAAAGPDPGGGFVPREHVADVIDAADWAAPYGEPLECEGRPGAIPQQVFETPKIARHIAVDERDQDTRIDGKPAVLPGEHVGGGRGVEQASEPEPADHAAAHPLGERSQISRGDWPGRQERRRGVSAYFGGSRHEDTVGHAGVQVHVAVERRAEAGGGRRCRRAAGRTHSACRQQR